ncbi:MAG: triphosphoribosyl-dephospho-CoA synthase CitG [Clostridia bacterium]
MRCDSFDTEFIATVGEVALKSILYEVAATPKPGLVDRCNSGAHNDMDFFTFMASSAALSGVFAQCAEEGLRYSSNDYKGLLERLRPLGIIAEERMLKATSGVNTHKGLIFSLGIISAAAGSVYRDTRRPLITGREISGRVKDMTMGLSERELKGLNKRKHLTTGEKLYIRHGIKGIRGQVESGFESVINTPMKVLREMLGESSLPLNDALIHVLLYLMLVVEDSNVIGRHGLEALDYVRECAQKALAAGGMTTTAGKEYIFQMDRDFIKRGISPGGAADLLAVTIMMHLMENGGMV